MFNCRVYQKSILYVYLDCLFNDHKPIPYLTNLKILIIY